MTDIRALLEIDNISKSFGGLRVIHELGFSVRRGQSTAIIGPNGAGKTTVFNLISGLYSCDAGRIVIDGLDVTTVPSRLRIQSGIARSFQNIRLMTHLTVLENLIVGQHARCGGGLNLLKPYDLMPGHRWKAEARQALAENGLEQYADESVSTLPYGTRKRVDLVRATLAGPKILLLDEPAAGLNPSETNDLRDQLAKLSERGMTLLVVEHDMGFVGDVCEHVIVLNFGEKIAEGTLAEVRRDPKVREAYLGSEAEDVHVSARG